MDFEPRRWWDCSLDVERLAWTSIVQAKEAAERLAKRRRTPMRFDTSPARVAASFAAIEHLRVDGREPSGWAPMSGYFPTAEGWVRLHANYPHHAAAITRALGASTRDELTNVLREWTALEVESAITQERGIAVAVRTGQQWGGHPQGVATANDPWVAVERHQERPPLPATSECSLLDGVRVLDFTRVIAGPTCSQLLACLGADVLRIDPPNRPELLEQHLSTGMGKRSSTIDLTTCRENLETLFSSADVVLLGYRPGSMTRFGLDPDDLLDRHSHLVIASLSAWGERGPWAQRPGFDSIVQAACGIATYCSNRESRPGALPVQALDHSTGYVMAAHVMDSLANESSGIIRISLLGAARTLLAYQPPTFDAPTGLTVPTVAMDSPYGKLTLVAPPLTVDRQTIERPIGIYGLSPLAWAPRSNAHGTTTPH
ncbi:CoA transferase [Rothia koreensis]|uniref:CoA transferase n=1 Tax=Rothia koreensis TaxID=592378 RepID=UPI003F223E3C